MMGYHGLKEDFEHATTDHAEAYVDGRPTRAGREHLNLLKRGLHDTYVTVEPVHLFRYLDERVFTYNQRDMDDYGRFVAVLRLAAGRRLAYAELAGKTG